MCTQLHMTYYDKRIPGVKENYTLQQNDISNFTKEVIVGKALQLQIDL